MIPIDTNFVFMRQELIHPELSYKLTGLCFEAHNEIGRYGKEKQYANFIESRLREISIPYKREIIIADTGNIFDFLIEDKIILELKSKRIITKVDYYQIQRYLQISNLRLCILVNFRDEYIKPKRIVRIDTTHSIKFQ